MATRSATSGGKTKNAILLDGHKLTLEDLEAIAKNRITVKLSDQAIKQLNKSRAVVEEMLESRQVVYGITTGFGKFKDVYIDPADSMQMQKNFLVSHATGVGRLLDREIVRASVAL
ncbi:MAG: aromatic amino acid lyase, partial [Candidatus Obscuribacterales bacterium]